MALFGKKKAAGDALWMKCEKCESQIYIKKWEKNQRVCPECGWHYRIDTPTRIRHILDANSFTELFSELESIDILSFRAKKSYKDKLVKAVKDSGRNDSATFGIAKISGLECVFGVIDPTFIMGSMGSVCGEKIARAAEVAREKKLPLIIISGSGGGARMEEGVNSLMQMVKVSAAIGKLQDAGGLYIVVQTNATMGGSMASFATLGDIILAEPMSLLGFTGPRVIKLTIKKELPSGFQTSEFLVKHGFIDEVVHRTKLRDKLVEIIKMLTVKTKREQKLEKGDEEGFEYETSELIAHRDFLESQNEEEDDILKSPEQIAADIQNRNNESS
ncbi:MAG: acetyl-CoA carboxylase, carboxyltransferase subunit beta [Planctomycetes bacterium]|nr:acetyl-CoA carboxylase, carboxyltransferase subunit beta [Planctomycetota bacterium]